MCNRVDLHYSHRINDLLTIPPSIHFPPLCSLKDRQISPVRPTADGPDAASRLNVSIIPTPDRTLRLSPTAADTDAGRKLAATPSDRIQSVLCLSLADSEVRGHPSGRVRWLAVAENHEGESTFTSCMRFLCLFLRHSRPVSLFVSQLLCSLFLLSPSFALMRFRSCQIGLRPKSILI